MHGSHLGRKVGMWEERWDLWGTTHLEGMGTRGWGWVLTVGWQLHGLSCWCELSLLIKEGSVDVQVLWDHLVLGKIKILKQALAPPTWDSLRNGWGRRAIVYCLGKISEHSNLVSCHAICDNSTGNADKSYVGVGWEDMAIPDVVDSWLSGPSDHHGCTQPAQEGKNLPRLSLWWC